MRTPPFTLFLFPGLLAPLAPALADDGGFVPHQAIVRLREGRSIAAFNTRYDTSTLDEIPARTIYLLELLPNVDEEQFVDLVEEDPDVLWAEVNYIGADPGPGTQSFFLASTRPAFESQPARRIIGLPAAHSVSTGAGVVVAVLDTGLDAAHPSFSGRVAPGGYNFVDHNTDTSDTGDGIDSDDDRLVDEMVGHGTFVAGTVLMAAPGAAVLPVRVMDSDGLTNAFRVARGLDHALRNGATVVNLSLGTPAQPEILEIALAWAVQSGVVVAAAAGNRGTSSPEYPSGTPSVAAAAATDDSDILAPFSNFGPHIDLCAPGVNIVSTVPGGYGLASGTSYSAPLIAGAAALVRSLRPSLTAAEVVRVLKRTSLDIEPLNPNYAGQIGAGRLSADAAVGATCYPDCDPSTAPGTLDIFDFLCFQNRFDANDPYACDCDTGGGPGVCDIFDFLCFQNAFATGCP